MSTTVGFVKHSRALMKLGTEDENRRILFEFFDELEGKVEGMKGYAILESVRDRQEMIILTFWETKEAMDSFYAPSNSALAELVEKSKGMLEQTPERNDYRILKSRM